MRSRMIGAGAVLLLGLTAAKVHAEPVPVVFPVTVTLGALTAENSYDVTFALFDAEADGTALWSETKRYRIPTSKKVAHKLGSVDPVGNPVSPLLFDRQLWVEASAVAKGVTRRSPRVKVGVVPYAVRSELAGNIEGHLTAAQVDATDALPGDVLTADGSGGASWEAPPGGSGGGTVTQVDTGTGLTGGPVTDVGEIAIDPAVVPRLGASNTFTGAQAVQTGGAAAVGLTVQGASAQSANLQEWKNSAGTALAAVGPTGTVAAAAFSSSGTVTAAGFSGSGSGLTNLNGANIVSGTVTIERLNVGTAAGTVAAGDHTHDAVYVNEGQTGSVTSAMILDGTLALADLGQNSCGSGEILKWDGAVWACAADLDTDTDTGVNAVTNGGGITGSIAGRTLTLGSDATVQRRSVAPTCPDGHYLKAVAADGTPTCAADGTGTFAGWSLTGNAGTNPTTNFIGTTEDVPFEVRVNNQRALRLERVTTTGSVTSLGQNAVGGDAGNSVTPGVTMATIAGGGGIRAGVAGPNRVTDVGGTVAGGFNNQAGNGEGGLDGHWFSFVGGGEGNLASGGMSTVVGGSENTASNFNAAVGGGVANTASGYTATVGGGQFNTASGLAATVAGGRLNTAGGDASFAAGLWAHVRTAGESGDANGDEGTFVWADGTNAEFASTGPNQFLIRASGGVGINKNHPATALDVNGTITAAGAAGGPAVIFTSSGAQLTAQQGGSIELGSSDAVANAPGAMPYIDFHFGTGVAQDFNARLINYADGQLRLHGSLDVTGNLSKGGGQFKIDHPLDPRNRYLSHSFVESPDMMNIYNGNVTTDGRGYATVELPAWFGALNRDFRYQLTVVDEADGEAFVQAKVVRVVAENRFTIRTSAPSVTVSWQVTGIRQDPYANAHRIPVEEEKPVADRGKCLHAEACGEQLAQGR